MFPVFMFSGAMALNMPAALSWIKNLVYFNYSLMIFVQARHRRCLLCFLCCLRGEDTAVAFCVFPTASAAKTPPLPCMLHCVRG